MEENIGNCDSNYVCLEVKEREKVSSQLKVMNWEGVI